MYRMKRYFLLFLFFFIMTKFSANGFASSLKAKPNNILPLNTFVLHATKYEVGVVKPGEMIFPDDLGEDWELDCYSR
jgi:hypothetical protein